MHFLSSLGRQQAAGSGMPARDPGAQQELAVLHALTAALHDAPDIEAVQEEILAAVTIHLGFPRAVIGVVDEEATSITGWLGRTRAGEPPGSSLSHPARLPLSPAGGPVAEALLEQQVRRATGPGCSANSWLNRHFELADCLILPLVWGIRPVGLLLVDVAGPGEEDGRQRTLEAIAHQSAAVLGMMASRLRRAREQAIQEERARIARDIHDTVSQSLFGLTYTLDGCLRLLDGDDSNTREAELRRALADARDAAEEARQELRQTIMELWPAAEVTAAQFEADLRRYAADILQVAALHLCLDIRGDFGALSPRARRSLYRIAQEGLANVAHHAAAGEARICLDAGERRAQLVIRDDGRGFEPQVALAQPHDDTHFGLRGIQTRAHALGGTCDIFSRPSAGTTLVVDIPVSEMND